MIVVSVCSAKHSPGATTLALALMCAWHTDPGLAGSELLIEADPAGGDLAARLGLSADRGLVSLAASARHGDPTIDVWAHSQALPAGGRVVLAPTDPARSAAAVAAVADRVPPLLRAGVDRAVIDMGRWSPEAATTAVLPRSDVVILVARPDLAGIDHARVAARTISEISGALIAVVLCGDRPYGPEDVTRTGVAPLSFALPVDRRSASDLYVGPASKLRRSPLIRAARTLTEQLAAVNAAPA